MSLTFDEKKATQAAGRLLERSGRRMDAMKLMRMLYLADREALLRWGRTISTDSFLFLKHGPALSQVLNLITDGDDPRQEPSQWNAHIARHQDLALDLRGDLDYRLLSEEELALLDEIVSLHGAKTPWELADLTRALPEWRDPQGGAIPFGAQDILTAHGKSKPAPAAEADPEEVYLNFLW
jgi:uncharacterized phage-associated protein